MTTALEENRILPQNDLFYNRALISSIDDVVISTDRNFIIKTWNTAAEKVYEINAAQAIGRRMHDIIYHEYIDTTEEQAQKQLVQENYWKGIVKLITKSGKTIFLQSVITTVRDAGERKLGYVGVSRDISSDISAKRSLHNFKSILTILDESFLVVDKNLKIVFMQLKGNAQKFFDSDYTTGDEALKYIPAKYAALVRRSYEKAFDGKIVNYHASSKTHNKLYFTLTYAPLKDSIGDITNVCLIIKDLTDEKEIELLEQKKAAVEKSLFESRKFFEEFMENSPLVAWITDKQGNMQYVNTAYLDLFNCTKEIVGKNIFDIYPAQLAEEYLTNNKKVIDTKNAIEVIEQSNATPLTKTYKIIKFPITFKGEVMVAGWGVDISNEIAAQESLSLLNQNKNKIMSVIAHDIRAPIGTNRNFINTIIQDFSSFEEEELLEYLTIMKQSLTKCYSLTDELLLWARNQMQTITYNPVPLNADAEIFKVIENLIPIAEDKKIIIENKLCKSPKIYADADMFGIVLRNLITNAIKFSKVDSKISVATAIDEKRLIVSIRDSGVGMKKVLTEKIMRKLNYESSFGTKGEKGAGLGLIIAKDYIERNNGELFIESEEGNGSTFSFTVDFVNE